MCKATLQSDLAVGSKVESIHTLGPNNCNASEHTVEKLSHMNIVVM